MAYESFARFLRQHPSRHQNFPLALTVMNRYVRTNTAKLHQKRFCAVRPDGSIQGTSILPSGERKP
ncbi:MAG: hypothetical protein U9N12_06930 [Euryarchaeota archaeon]|nr:hypothetical protein [Euryarchaeota archaeon]